MKAQNILLKMIAAIVSVVLIFSQNNIIYAENDSSAYTAEDVCALQNFLLAKKLDIPENADYDLNGDGTWDSFDLCLMKQRLLSSFTRTINVSNSDELKKALTEAQPGDTILLESGTYQTNESGKSASLFYAAVSGTEQFPITLKSADPENPAVLSGNGTSENIVLYIVGAYWNIENIVCCNAKKGIMLDQVSHSVIKNVEVYNIGQEGIHLRDGSSECQVLNCKVHDTGLLSPQYGEGIYIGSAKSTTEYSYECNDNVISGCVLGPNITAEHVDIKEYTTGNVIENCTMYGSGMTETDSYIDIKGNETIVRENTCDTQGNTNITDAFQVHSQVDGWGINNFVYENTITFSGETEYIVRTWSDTSCTVYNNIRFPENTDMMYRAYSGSTITNLNF